MKTYSRVYARIDLDAIEYNIEQMKLNIKPTTKIMPIIKCDGYGHGAIQTALLLENHEAVWGYGVATLDEAVVLRKSNVKKPILVLGCIFPDQYEEMLKYEIRMNVYTKDMVTMISSLAKKLGKTAYLHIKLDTGMGRLGFAITEECVESIKAIDKLSNLCIEGIFSHFAKADEKDKEFTFQQIKLFDWMIERLKEEGVSYEFKHCSNSAAVIDTKEAHYDLVRPGISTFGLYPSEEVHKEVVDLRPALALKSHIAFVKEIGEGTPVSYGGIFIAPKRMKVATIPVGYGDGFPREMSNKGHVLIRGQVAPIIGRICMDQFMVDVTDIEDAKFGDKVTLIGNDNGAKITIEMLNEWSGRYSYEFVCGLSKRIPRVYMQNGQIEEQVDYFA